MKKRARVKGSEIETDNEQSRLKKSTYKSKKG